MAATQGLLIQDGPSAGALSRAMRPNRKGTRLLFEFISPKDPFLERGTFPLELEILGISHNPDPEYTGWIVSVKFQDVPAQIRYNPHTRIGKILGNENFAEG